MYDNGEMEAFSYEDRDNFKDSGNLIVFLFGPAIS